MWAIDWSLQIVQCLMFAPLKCQSPNDYHLVWMFVKRSVWEFPEQSDSPPLWSFIVDGCVHAANYKGGWCGGDWWLLLLIRKIYEFHFIGFAVMWWFIIYIIGIGCAKWVIRKTRPQIEISLTYHKNFNLLNPIECHDLKEKLCEDITTYSSTSLKWIIYLIFRQIILSMSTFGFVIFFAPKLCAV